MSIKTHILLQRSGRDQFGEQGDGHSQHRSPGLSAAEISAYHASVDAFYAEFGAAWENCCDGKSSKDIWEALFPHKKPAFSTFDKIRRAFVSLPEFLKYVLVLYKWKSLSVLGYSHKECRSILERFEPLKRYCIEPRIGERKPGRSAGYISQQY